MGHRFYVSHPGAQQPGKSDPSKTCSAASVTPQGAPRNCVTPDLPLIPAPGALLSRGFTSDHLFGLNCQSKFSWKQDMGSSQERSLPHIPSAGSVAARFQPCPGSLSRVPDPAAPGRVFVPCKGRCRAPEEEPVSPQSPLLPTALGPPGSAEGKGRQ